MTTNILQNPNSNLSNIINQFKFIKNQREENSIGDNKVLSFSEEPEKIEPFISLKHFMFDKLILLLIITILSFFIMKCMDYI